MISLLRTNSNNAHFQDLVLELDKDLAKKNGESNAFFAQYNTTDLIKHVVVAMQEQAPLGCGGMKAYNASTMEIKRMFVPLNLRGKGIAGAVLKELETWAKELGYERCVLETGDKMPEAIGLYKKCGYQVIANYGPYENVASSICFEKML